MMTKRQSPGAELGEGVRNTANRAGPGAVRWLGALDNDPSLRPTSACQDVSYRGWLR